MLFDIDSAKIKITGGSKSAICGTVNAKNRMGAYVGAAPFYLLRGTDYVEVYSGDPSDSDFRTLANTRADDPTWRKTLDEVSLKCLFAEQWPRHCGSAPGPVPAPFCKATKTPTDFMAFLKQYEY